MIKTPCSQLSGWSLFVFAVLFLPLLHGSDLGLKKGDQIVFIGGTLADRANHFGYIETRLQTAFPELGLTVRNMGWSGDEVALMPRPLKFGTLEEHLSDKNADVIFLFFGGNEAFKGDKGIASFISDYKALVKRLEAQSARLVFVSPMAHEQLPEPWPDATERNRLLEKYTEAIRDMAEELKRPFVDLFHPTRTLMAENYNEPLTINGIHLTDDGYRILADIIGAQLNWPAPETPPSESLRSLIVEKNRQFFLRWRPVNGEYVFGRRNIPYGIVTYPPEMELLDKQIAELDREIHKEAKNTGQ